MRGHLSAAADPLLGGLASWEATAVDAVGTVIEFWGFKRNHGRLWAFLYLRGRPLSAAELVTELGLSKGAVSMITRELEQWGVLRRVRAGGAGRRGAWQFVAEQDLMVMVRSVIERREISLVARVEHDLEAAEQGARNAKGTPPEELERLERLRRLAALVAASLELFLASAHMDMGAALHLLEDPARS